MWSLDNGACVRIMRGHTDHVMALTVLGDGRLASVSNDRSIRVWNMTSGECEASVSKQTFSVFSFYGAKNIRRLPWVPQLAKTLTSRGDLWYVFLINKQLQNTICILF